MNLRNDSETNSYYINTKNFEYYTANNNFPEESQ